MARRKDGRPRNLPMVFEEPDKEEDDEDLARRDGTMGEELKKQEMNDVGSL